MNCYHNLLQSMFSFKSSVKLVSRMKQKLNTWHSDAVSKHAYGPQMSMLSNHTLLNEIIAFLD